jgi:Icc-related predicted phosphoesterase
MSPLKIIATSDLHGQLPPIEPCDLLLLAGDLCPASDHSLFAQMQFLAGPFADWLEQVPAKRIVGVAGNHDFIFEKRPDLVPRTLRWDYLQDSATEVHGLKVYGTPWQPWFYDWAFNLSEEELVKKWARIPEGTDVLVCHGPPIGYGDKPQGPRPPQGSPGLLHRIEQIAPGLVVFGHIHEGRGRWQLRLADGREVTLANVTHVNLRYEPVYPPMTFEL